MPTPRCLLTTPESISLCLPPPRFARDDRHGGSFRPAWTEPPRSVFHDSNLHESRTTDRVEVFPADHRRRNAAAIVLDPAERPLLHDVGDHQATSRFQDTECIAKYVEFRRTQVDHAVAHDGFRRRIGERDAFDGREEDETFEMRRPAAMALAR